MSPVLKDLVGVASVSSTWNPQAFLRDVAALWPMMRSKSPAKSKLISCEVSESQPEKQSLVPWKGRCLVKEKRKMKGKVVTGSKKEEY
jgi:hypothetical protein